MGQYISFSLSLSSSFFLIALYWITVHCLLIRESELIVLLLKYAYIKAEDGGLGKDRQKEKSIETELLGSSCRHQIHNGSSF